MAVVDSSDDKHYHIAQDVDMTDQITTLHYLGTKSKTLCSAVWKKLYHHPGSGQVVSEQPANLIRNWMRFTGVIDTKAPEDSLIIQANIGFTDTMRINAVSRNILGRLPLSHHRMPSGNRRGTWNP